jgi:hypothetical protein
VSSGRVWVPDVKPGTLSSPKPDGSTPSPLTSTSNEMTFFVTSAGSGKRADLGGLSGADALCERLAHAAGTSGMKNGEMCFTCNSNLQSALVPAIMALYPFHPNTTKAKNVWENEKKRNL